MADAFDSLVEPEPNSGCFIWTGPVNQADGYGRVYHDAGRRYNMAHRLAWQRERGPIPPGLELDHLCRNRQCVNVAHLEPVTSYVNRMRGVSPVGINSRKTGCPYQHGPYDVYRDGGRRCSRCERERDAGRPR